MATAYLHLNGVDYELPEFYALDEPQRTNLFDNLRKGVAGEPGAYRTQEVAVLIDGVRTSLVVRKDAVATLAVYVTGDRGGVG